MKIFVTGASGFIGGAIAEKLAQTHEVFALARSQNAADKILKLGAVPVRADLLSIAERDLIDTEVLIHCAAYAEEWGTEEQFFKANVLGTKHLLATAKSAGVKRFIHISTEAACFHGQDMSEIDETYPLSINSPYLYSRTKALAEQLVVAANNDSFKTITLRPRMVWGPGDQSILPAVIEMIKDGKFSWINNGKFRTSSTHISNLVHAVGLALTKGRGGEVYFVADDGEVEMKSFLTRYLQTQKINVPNKSIPKALARIAARFVEFLWKGLGLRSKPPLVRFSVDMMSANCTVKTDKAKLHLGYFPVISREDGLAQMPLL